MWTLCTVCLKLTGMILVKGIQFLKFHSNWMDSENVTATNVFPIETMRLKENSSRNKGNKDE